MTTEEYAALKVGDIVYEPPFAADGTLLMGSRKIARLTAKNRYVGREWGTGRILQAEHAYVSEEAAIDARRQSLGRELAIARQRVASVERGIAVFEAALAVWRATP